MREIEYRGLVVNELANGEKWISSDEEYHEFYINKVEKTAYINGHEVLYNSVSQYTGLTDVNGVHIYEGDIVRVHDGEDFIWTEQVLENSGGYWVDENYLGAIRSFCEVIGNIYEHSHLLD